jgi:hypothetical protein
LYCARALYGFVFSSFLSGVFPMTQAELNQAVADATGESVSTIRRRGFSIVTPLQVFNPNANDDYELPSVVDWDALALDQRRSAA